ncbi:MAG: carboxypeptidase regulatory-like domain-containing protein [Bacteroidetes bacterium]|nr:carboxypeptidase regulatory-like domain-containing protein [Bacteroidota bacterium]
MKNLKILLIYFFAIATSIMGCKGPTGLDGAVGSQLRGDVFGYVDVYDVNGRLLPDRRGVEISTLESIVSDVTDSTGKWTLKNLYAGIYTIIAKKSGYTSTTNPNFQFVGGGTAFSNSTMGIIQLPSFMIQNVALSGKVTDSLGQQLKIDINPSAVIGDNRAFIIIYGKTPTVSINTSDALITSTITYNYKEVGSAIVPLKNIVATLQNTYGLKSGDKVYAVVYPSSAHVNNVGVYTDPTSKKTIYTRISTPYVAINFLIP